MKKIKDRKYLQQLISTTSKKSDFNFVLCKAMLEVTIPLNKLNNPQFKDFIIINKI
jgi:hypothetical protein